MGPQLTQMKTRQDKKRLDTAIGGNILKHRKHRKLSRDELAEMIGLNPSYIGLIERGERGVSIVALSKLAKAFDISLDTLLDETDIQLEPVSSRGAFLKKAHSLTSLLDERELKAVIFYIKGILTLRDASN